MAPKQGCLLCESAPKGVFVSGFYGSKGAFGPLFDNDISAFGLTAAPLGCDYDRCATELVLMSKLLLENKASDTASSDQTSKFEASDVIAKKKDIPRVPISGSTEEQTADISRESAQYVNNEIREVGGRKRKRFNAIWFKALFKPQQVQVEL
nr:hypothetical protein [Tanacetum cinerariifolium]